MQLDWTNDWTPLIKEHWHQPYMEELRRFVALERKNDVVFPPEGEVFQALEVTPLAAVKVVILGQDPYHGEGQAHGLSFSVQKGVTIPKSLQNIFKELESDVGIPAPAHGNLLAWAKQGVLLLNTTLTVRKGEAFSHRGKGWDTFTDAIITELNNREAPVLFILWGKPAQQKAAMIDEAKHGILTAPHPSPLAAYRGFFGSKPFSKTNEWLKAHNKSPIDWRIN